MTDLEAENAVLRKALRIAALYIGDWPPPEAKPAYRAIQDALSQPSPVAEAIGAVVDALGELCAACDEKERWVGDCQRGVDAGERWDRAWSAARRALNRLHAARGEQG